MTRNNYDYSKLLSRIKTCGYTQFRLSEAIHLSLSILRQKLNNQSDFKQAEIEMIASKLNILDNEIGEYFFKQEVQHK